MSNSDMRAALESKLAPAGQAPLSSALPVSKVLPAYEQVAEQLRQLIIKGDLAPGDRLPVEGDLCAVFGVSRSTVREAVRALTARDLVHTVRGATGGTFVSKTDPLKVSQYLETSIGLMSSAEGIGVAEILEARELVEVPAARFASTRATPEQIGSLRESVERGAASAGRSSKFRENRGFHGLIVEASSNVLLQIMNDSVFNVLQAKFLRPGVSPDLWRDIDADHVEILEHIAAGDADKAALAMNEHLKRLRPLYQGPTGADV